MASVLKQSRAVLVVFSWFPSFPGCPSFPGFPSFCSSLVEGEVDPDGAVVDRRRSGFFERREKADFGDD